MFTDEGYVRFWVIWSTYFKFRFGLFPLADIRDSMSESLNPCTF